MQTILKLEEEELTRRVLTAQLEDPCNGDFAELVRKDCKDIGLQFDLSFVASTGVAEYRKIIKNKIRAAALKHLKTVQQTHKQINRIVYEKLETQPYLKSHLFSNEENQVLFALRSRAELIKAHARFD